MPTSGVGRSIIRGIYEYAPPLLPIFLRQVMVADANNSFTKEKAKEKPEFAVLL